MTPTRSCPHCADPLDEARTVCPNCGGGLTDNEAAAGRPVGLTFCAWADGILSVLWVFAAIGLLFAGISMLADRWVEPGIACLGAAVIALVIAGLFLAMGLGLLWLKRWARIMALVVSSLFLAACVLEAWVVGAVLFDSAVKTGYPVTADTWLRVVVSLLGLTFFGGQLHVLMRSEARNAFLTA